MKKLLTIALLALVLAGCKTQTVYVPVESVRMEYKDHILRDSVYIRDSILMHTKGDTVFIEKYKMVYKNKLVRDSVLITDSIQVPYPVTEYREVNRLNSFQSFQIWCGRIMLLLLAGYAGVRWIKR